MWYHALPSNNQPSVPNQNQFYWNESKSLLLETIYLAARMLTVLGLDVSRHFLSLSTIGQLIMSGFEIVLGLCALSRFIAFSYREVRSILEDERGLSENTSEPVEPHKTDQLLEESQYQELCPSTQSDCEAVNASDSRSRLTKRREAERLAELAERLAQYPRSNGIDQAINGINLAISGIDQAIRERTRAEKDGPTDQADGEAARENKASPPQLDNWVN